MAELENFSMLMTADQKNWLRSKGVGLKRISSDRVKNRTGGVIGTGRIRVSCGIFESVESDQPKGCDGKGEVLQAIVQGVWEVSPPPWFVDLVDLVAWDPQRPARYWRRLGTANWLGEWAVRWALDDGGVLRMCRTPLSWLQASSRSEDAACLLDAGGRILREVLWDHGIEAVVPDNEAHAAELYKALRQRPPKPKIPDVLRPGQRVAV